MAPTFFSKSVDLKLIQLVKESPLLYNPRHPKYTDSDSREVTWQKIGDCLNRPAVEFAGIQCQIHFGDFQEDKHKPGFIENMNEYLPEQYAGVWGVEKKIFKEYKKHQRLGALEAKHLYIKTARALPTYGVTFFLVKEKQKDKKKLVPRLLGINAESILRLDEVTKEILQTWPLTHVKTYHAAKEEIFTLNFGDYSDKPYSVKTCDAYRIRDILEDYIDIIRKRMMQPYSYSQAESAYITQDNVTSSTANIVQHISNNPMKIVEQSFVGPSKIVPFEGGSEARQGTQIMTVMQMVVSEKGQHHQQAVKGGVPMRADMSLPFTRRLNRLNSNSVKVVSVLTDPTEAHIEDARKIIEAMNEDMPFVRDGVKDTIDKQTNEDDKKKLQDQLNELNELMKSLTHNTSPGSVDASEAEDAAMRIADLTTQMYFALDARNQRRSRIISRSRKSFIEDEKCQRNLRKASFIAATSSALAALDQSQAALNASYSGGVVGAARAAELEAAALDQLGKVNAAVAHYTMAYSDPQDVDYEAAINSMNTIHELTPELAKDIQALCSAKDPLTRKQILLDSKNLCGAIKKICSSTEDRQKLQGASKEYADASGKLVFTFGKGRNYQKENEMLDLADDVGVKTSQLLISAQELAALAPAEPAAADVDAAGVRTAEAAKDLISRVQLTAPTIQEPHCQSAVTAAAEALSSSIQHLATSWKPLLEDPARHERGEKMHNQVMELAKALDRLKGAYSGLGGDEPDEVFDGQGAPQERQKLQFINTLSANKKRWQEVEDLLKQPALLSVEVVEAQEAQRRLAQRLGLLNAAIASLLAATSDREHPNYAAAEQAVNTINELMPQVVHDTKMASAIEDPETSAAMMAHVRALCDASKGICASSEEQSAEGLSDAIAKFTNASGKLVFGVSRKGNPKKENQILELTEDACQKTSQLLSGVQQLSVAVGRGAGGELDAKGAACADAAQALLTTAQVTAPSIYEPRCQSALLSSVDKLSSSGQDVANSWRPFQGEPQHKQQVQGLQHTLGELEGKLDMLRSACRAPAEDVQSEHTPEEQQRLQFIKTMSGARDQMQRVEKALDKPIPPPQSSEKAAAIQHKLSGRLSDLNAAIASLLSATADREKPDYRTAEDAVKTISELLPHVVQDTQSSSANKDEATRAAMLDLLRELCEASRAVCSQADGTDSQGLSDAVSKFSNASGKLVYVVNPRSNANKENQIMALSAGASNAASQMVSAVGPLSEAVGGPRGAALDSRGAAVADAARGLMLTAQVTAPSISEPQCQQALVSSADRLSSSAQELAACWKPLLQDPKYNRQAVVLQAPLEQLQNQLDALRKACLADEAKGIPSEQQKLKFIKSQSGVAEQIQKAQKALDKPIPPPLSSDKAAAVQQKLSRRLGELNAAIAALLAATADREQPDYKTAEQAIKTISELMPHVVQDTQSSSANKDEATRAAMLDLLRELCEASRAVCSQADGTDTQGLNDAVSKFADASGKLVYVVSPKVNADREKQIMALSAGACNSTSQLLAGVQELSTAVGGEGGQELDTRGASVADAAQGLLQTAQVTAPSISEPQCQQTLVSSADRLSSSAEELAACWKPLLQDPKYNKQAVVLQAPLEQLQTQLEALKKACQIPDGDVQSKSASPRELQKLQFVKTMTGAKERIHRAEKALDKPIPPPLSSEKAAAVQQKLAGRLGDLNAAIAALLSATADRENPDYRAAEQAISNISELLPHVVQDTQSSSANKDEATRAAMLDLLRELCEASRAVCSQADGTDTQGLNDAVSKFANASGKLVYVVSPRVNADREKQIMALSAGACNSTSQLLAGVQELSTAVGGEGGQELDTRGASVADAAQGLLQTAQVTAPSISEPQCQQALVSSADRLSSSAQELAACWKPLLQDPKYNKQAVVLQAPLEQLQTQLEALKKACQIPDDDIQTTAEIQRNQDKLKFVKTMSGAREQIQKAQKALDKPLPPPLPSVKADALQQRLSGRLGELNAAIAALLAATANREKPDYQKAEQAVKSISELMPHIVQDTQSSCADKDEASRAAMLDTLRKLCQASELLCSQADGGDPQALSDAVSKFSGASGKLVYVTSPRVNANREQQIIDLAAGVCNKTSQLLSGVQQVSTTVGGSAGQELDARGAAVADAAQGLLQTAQVTAAFISDPHCKAALLSSADRLPASCKELEDGWELLVPASFTQETAALQRSLSELKALLEALKRACDIPDEVPQMVKKQPPPTPTRKSLPPPPPVRGGSSFPSRKKSSDSTKEFLDRIRCEESHAMAPVKVPCSTTKAPSAVKTDDEKRMHQQFLQTVEDAEKSIKKAQEGLVQASRSHGISPAISAGDCLSKQARLQRNIALAGVEVAALVGANYADTVDYPAASKSTKALPQLMNSIVEDGTVLSSTVNEEARRAFLEDMLQMCQATRNLCDAAKNDREKLNDAAVEFGDTSTKLLYVVSNDVDPTLEKEIITRAKAIGDSVAQISVSAGSLASGAPTVQGSVPALCDAGARCQHAAGKLLYTAKLVAPSIYETPCQEALHQSADQLSTELSAFQESWKPFSSAPSHAATVKDLNREADNLHRILEGLKSEVKGGRIGQRREIEKLVVEDTPIRQLTMKIMEDAKELAEHSDLSPALKKEYLEYSKRLSDALRALDLANARCKRTPHDAKKRRDLENAVQNLQMILLQSRPSRGDKEKSNIVDLRDFIDEVSAEAEKLSDVSSGLKVPSAADKKTLQEIEANGRKLAKAAYDLTHTDDATGFDTSFNDILDVDIFGQECDDVIQDINRQLQSMEDAKARNLLHCKILPLTESCNMLRFATKSGISASKSATLDATLDDLEDIEGRAIKSIVRDGGDTAVTLRVAPPSKPMDTGAATSLCRAVCGAGAGAGAVPRATLTAYIASCAATTDTNDPEKRNQLLKHLYKVVHLLRSQTAAASKRVVTWQPVDDPEVASITEQILQEIQNPETKFQSESGKVKKILDESDLRKLLIPGPGKIVGDHKKQEDKLTQLTTKLNSMCGTTALSTASPEALARSAHAASEAALELAAVARGCKDHKDPVQCERIEESVQEMTFTTYGLLKTAELSCQDPNNMNARRRLLDACRSLNDSINKLMSASSSASKLKQECGSLFRSLQAQQAAVQQAPLPTSAMPYEECCAKLDEHQEVMYKLNNDQPMSRQEFARSLHEVNEAVCRTTEISTQCAYLISVSEKDGDIAKKGPVDVPRIQRCIESLQDSCMSVIASPNIYQAKEEADDLHKRVQDFSRALDEAQMKVKDGGVKATLTRAKGGVTTSAAELWETLKEASDMDKVTSNAVSVLEEVNRSHSLLERCPLVPLAGEPSPEAQALRLELSNNSMNLLSQTQVLMKEVGAHEDDETMTWVTFNTSRTKLLDAYEALVKSIRLNGQRAGILEGLPEDETEEFETHKKTYLEVQVDLANKWLQRPACKAEARAAGQHAVRNVIDIATKMSEDLKGSEREEIRNVIVETEELLTQCSAGYDIEKYSVLMDRIKELKKAVQRGVVTRVVEDFMEDHPMADLDLIIDSEQDEQKRKFLLERKIAELLAQLGRVTRTARCVAAAAGTQGTSQELVQCSEQTELLAPMLVQAAQERIASPDNQAVIEKYKALLAKYAESISKVRDLCDRSVDPMDFVQTAGDTMQRMREASAVHNDPEKGQRTSNAIIKLANRSIEVSLSCPATRRDPELLAALRGARRRVLAATPAAGCRASRLPDWKESTAEVLRTTGEVESALGGENIFKNQPVAHGANQQIYSVAHELHKCVSEWSSRDNEIVAVARRMAVLMARLSQYMETDKKHALIATSRAIVQESHEVAELAKKLAHECTDHRIKTNLLQTCERIPTISAQLKMLTTVKASSLGHQGNEEDKEAMDMLVGNAQSLMLSIQEVVKAAASASVKIMSQRGPRLRWVRKTYY